MVESEFGFVDASVDAQFEQVAQALADAPPALQAMAPHAPPQSSRTAA
jgi:hypothetical protein